MKRVHLSSLNDLNRQREELKSSDRSLEKFAREKYRMKRDNEDIFVIVVDSTEKKD
jgi:cell division protein FtsB